MSYTPPTSSPYPLHNPTSASPSHHHRSQTSTPPPSSGSHSPTAASSTSASSYLPSALTYTVSSLLRRMNSSPSASTSPTPMTSSMHSDHSFHQSHPPALGAIYTPPPVQRQPSPFQPPPLTPLTLSGHHATTSPTARLLTRSLAEEIRLLVPPRLQLQETWHLAYSLEQDGVSLATLYKKCALLAEDHRRGGWVLVVRDAVGGIFGAYLSDPPRPSPHYYGTGECFLWRASILSSNMNPVLGMMNLPPPPSADTTNMQRSTTIASSSLGVGKGERRDGSGSGSGRSTPGTSIRFKAFPYSGVNDYLILCEPHFLSVGGGWVSLCSESDYVLIDVTYRDGHYGLWLDDVFEHGISMGCPTFGNEGLSDEGEAEAEKGTGKSKGKFGVLGVEVWCIGR